MSPTEALDRFRRSMDIDYERWHDGIGYDLEAIDSLDEHGKKQVENLLIPRAGNDWRDLEALDRLGTQKAVKAILKVRASGSPEMRLRAYEYGPAASEAEWSATIVALLTSAKPFEGLTVALRSAIEHPSDAVVAELWRHVSRPSDEISYHAAETLALIGGVITDPFENPYRPICLRVQGPERPDRLLAVTQLQDLLKGTSARRPG